MVYIIKGHLIPPGASEHTQGEGSITAQRRQLVASTPARPQCSGHRWVVQILVDFPAMLLVLVRLRLLWEDRTTAAAEQPAHHRPDLQRDLGSDR